MKRLREQCPAAVELLASARVDRPRAGSQYKVSLAVGSALNHPQLRCRSAQRRPTHLPPFREARALLIWRMASLYAGTGSSAIEAIKAIKESS